MRGIARMLGSRECARATKGTVGARSASLDRLRSTPGWCRCGEAGLAGRRRQSGGAYFARLGGSAAPRLLCDGYDTSGSPRASLGGRQAPPTPMQAQHDKQQLGGGGREAAGARHGASVVAAAASTAAAASQRWSGGRHARAPAHPAVALLACLQGGYKYHQYQVVGRHVPTEKDAEPTLYRMKLWATDPVRAKSKFW